VATLVAAIPSAPALNDLWRSCNKMGRTSAKSKVRHNFVAIGILVINVSLASARSSWRFFLLAIGGPKGVTGREAFAYRRRWLRDRLRSRLQQGGMPCLRELCRRLGDEIDQAAW